MFTSTFIFAKKEFDDEFHALDQAISAAAKAIPGYRGEETWENPSTGLVSNVYYWDSMQDLEILIRTPTHLQAKLGHAKWLDRYRVVIAEVRCEYGVKGLGLMAMP
jgi:heme-degrading monooxygenase HmoA